jgi:magnesium chelatase family protein
MLARVYSCALIGLDGQLVEVEVDITRAEMPNTMIVGLPDAAVQEAKERVRAAVRNSGLTWPFNNRIVVNLAPADLRKEGPSYDLPVAVGILAASGQIVGSFDDAVFMGELSLDGEVRSVHGVLPMVALARKNGKLRAFVPAANSAEASLVSGVEVYPVTTLASLASHLLGAVPIEPHAGAPAETQAELFRGTDFADIVGQEHVKRALEVAAAGGHNVIMRGPPGSGKTLLARAMPSILPPMTPEEALEVTRIYSVAALLPSGAGLITTRPFRAPHHTISHAGLVGGGTMPRPGEITLCHRGVLFLDELPEFGPQVLDVLRQPLEDRLVTISRARMSVTFPANFSLVAAMNPCPCGFYGDPTRECTCPAAVVSRYQRRISGPLLDRIDLFVDVPRVAYEKLASTAKAEPSVAVAARVHAARRVQHARFASDGAGGTTLNAEMNPSQVRDFAQLQLEDGALNLLKIAVERLNLSARAFHRVLKLARTIADLAGSDIIGQAHLAESIQYRERAD